MPEKNNKRNTNTSVRFKKRKSMKEKIKKTAKDSKTQIICLLKKLPASSVGANDFIVTRPAKIIGTIKKTKNQSILLRVFNAFSVIKSFQFDEKNIEHGNYFFDNHLFGKSFRPCKSNFFVFLPLQDVKISPTRGNYIPFFIV